MMSTVFFQQCAPDFLPQLMTHPEWLDLSCASSQLNFGSGSVASQGDRIKNFFFHFIAYVQDIRKGEDRSMAGTFSYIQNCAMDEWILRSLKSQNVRTRLDRRFLDWPSSVSWLNEEIETFYKAVTPSELQRGIGNIFNVLLLLIWTWAAE
jgi:hypothetical protein